MGAVAVLDYGIGNLRSAQKALQHLGADARLVTEPGAADGASGIVLPGVGSFGPCARALRASGLDEVVTRAVSSGQAFLGICVGFQLLYEGSEEDPGQPGLGVLPGIVRALPDTVKRPQMQWNCLIPTAPSKPAGGPSGALGIGAASAGEPEPASPRPGGPPALLDGLGPTPWVYFVHSYAPQNPDHAVATCDYGGPVVAAVQRGPLWGTQFHPEKSGRVGLRVLQNFVRLAEAVDG